MILVRHAHAGTKADWIDDDEQRPLSARGRSQASSLIGTLAADPVECVWSSPAVRCLETVAPLAAARGLPVLSTQLLAKDAPIELLLAWLLAHHSSPWVLCTHGEVFTSLLTAGCSAGFVTTPAQVTEKGGAWRISQDGDARAELDYLPPSMLGGVSLRHSHRS